MSNVRLKIPGKIMLAGEYSVLRGGHSLAATIDRTMTVEVEAAIEGSANAATWTVGSDLWDEPRLISDLRAQEQEPLLRAVQAGARKSGLSGGVVSVHSNLSIQDGIGSSSALRLGVSAAFDLLKNGRDSTTPSGVNRRALHQGWQLQAEAQGQASGYDLVAQYLGGLVEFHADFQNDEWTPHWFRLPVDSLSTFVHVFVGGAGAPTKTTMQSTNSWLDHSSKGDRLLEFSENLVDAFMAQIRFPAFLHFKKLVEAVGAHRGLFTAIPTFPAEIARALAGTPGHDASWTWKTTGAGGEDALLLIGSQVAIRPAINTLFDLGWRRLDAKFCDTGISIESLNGDYSEVVSTRKPNTTGSTRTGQQ
ncbi:MAG: hypothetical protein NTV34_01150 [Proteobacteria bacterium]|nr:hypothetical protein [Pseudomonadota bacterium]